MAKFQIVKGSTSVILPVFIQDSSSTTGAGLGSLIHTSSIVGGYMKRDGLGVALAVDEDVTTEGTYQAPSVVGKVRIGTPANMRTGVYELHFHNDLFTTADWVTISLGGATNMADLLIEVQLTTLDLNVSSLTATRAEPGQGLPASTTDPLTKLDYLYKAWRNKSDQTATTYQLYNDDASTVDHKATITANGTTATKGEIATGP